MHRRTALTLALFLATAATAQTQADRIQAPRFWNDRELSDWATPVAGLNVRPGHFSEKEYYAAPVGEWVRTYPVYFPGREPAGYWDMIRNKKPEPLLRPGARTQAQWIAEGQRVFRELDIPLLRSYDPKLIGSLRSAEAFTKLGGHAQKDGTVLDFRWVPTAKGLALGGNECAACHLRVLPDGSILDGPQFNNPPDGVGGQLFNFPPEVFSPGDTKIMALWRQFAVPWVPNDIHERIKSLTGTEVGELLASNPPGTFPRFNGSPYYTTKVPDLIGLQDRKYIDHTATHRLRGPADVMRYAALISCCDRAEFGPHRILTDRQRRITGRYTDEILFALAQYLFALEPPKNPNPVDARLGAGQEIFKREGCVACHTPPLYTNNKLTLAQGFTPPKDHPLMADIMPLSVGTDAGLALKTRKGTGLYKVPSLKGVWYRGLLSHDGSVSTLEEWFDPARLRDDYVPSGFKGYKVKKRAVPGHEFGLKLNVQDKAALIAFLRTL
jgi:mono/diheme cytochrome c family protein